MKRTWILLLIINVALFIGIILVGKQYQAFQIHEARINYDQILSRSWQFYKTAFIQYDGRVIDTSTPNLISTSEGQSYALLRAAQQKDKSAFDLILNWTYDNLGIRNDGLFAWQWGMKDDGTWGVLANGGNNSATDGDEQVALALINAYNEWHDKAYLTRTQALLHNIYLHDTTENDGHRYIVAGNWANDTSDIAKTTIYVNPSYLQVGSYKTFSKIDPTDNWSDIIGTSYKALNLCTFNKLDIAKLPSNWCLIDKKTLSVVTLSPSTPPLYSYDAFRVMYHMAVDYVLTRDPQDKSYLQNTKSAFENLSPPQFLSTFNVQTNEKESSNSIALATGALANEYITDFGNRDMVYRDIILSKYRNGAFGNGYYDENWMWFITYLYSGQINKDFPIT